MRILLMFLIVLFSACTINSEEITNETKDPVYPIIPELELCPPDLTGPTTSWDAHFKAILFMIAKNANIDDCVMFLKFDNFSLLPGMKFEFKTTPIDPLSISYTEGRALYSGIMQTPEFNLGCGEFPSLVGLLGVYRIKDSPGNVLFILGSLKMEFTQTSSPHPDANKVLYAYSGTVPAFQDVTLEIGLKTVNSQRVASTFSFFNKKMNVLMTIYTTST